MRKEDISVATVCTRPSLLSRPLLVVDLLRSIPLEMAPTQRPEPAAKRAADGCTGAAPAGRQ